MNIFFRRIVWLIMLIPAVYLAILWKQIPESVPLHFDLKGNVNKYGTKHEFLVLMLSLIFVNAIVYLIVTNIYKIDPKKYASQNKDRMQKMAFSVSLYLTAIWMVLIYEITHNDISMMPKFIFIAMGLLFALLGNNMYNLQPNYFAGIRLPWTLENEENWRKTHQLAGRLWFFGGIFFTILAILISSDWIGYIGFGILAIFVMIPIGYSYKLYKNQDKKTQA